MLTARTKTKVGAKLVKQVAKHPRALRVVPPAAGAGWKLAKPLAKRRARRRAERMGDTAREIATTMASYAPYVARATALLAPPKRRRVAPRLGVGALLVTGAVLGAAAVYLIAPKGGREHRRQLRHLVK
jgi:hypothetical protein